jgi:hypothetical protein
LPESFKGKVVPFSALGKAYLTPDGLTIHLDPYDGWFYADGPKDLIIKKRILLGLGAHREIWQ